MPDRQISLAARQYSMTMAIAFSDIASIRSLSSHSYETILKDAWSIGAVPNGGYVSSLLLVARQHMTLNHPTRRQPHPINLQIQFLRRTSANIPTTFTVRDVKLGSRISNLHITLRQSNGPNRQHRDNVVGHIIMSNLSAEQWLSLPPSTSNFHLHPAPPPVNLPLLLINSRDDNWALQPVPFSGFHSAAQHIHVYRPRLDLHPQSTIATNKVYQDQWVRFHPEGSD